MVLFSKWSEAEAAAESLEGTTTLSNAQRRPLVVHFANPRKLRPRQPPEGGLAPKKLFVGQVPQDVTEDMLHLHFEPYGEIEYLNILRTQRGQSAGCGFVQFRKWSQAENAIEAHNGKTRLGGSEVPLVVKFADAKRKDQALQHLGLGLRGAAWMLNLKQSDAAAAEFAAYQLGAQQWATERLLRGNPMLGGNVAGNQLALMQNLMPQQGYQQGHNGQQAPYLQSHHILQPDRNVYSGVNDRIQEAEFANHLINQAAGLGGMNSLGKQPELAEENPTGSTAELAQQLGQLQLAVIDQQQQEQAPSFQGQNPNGQNGYPASKQRLPTPLAQAYQGYPRHPLVPQDGMLYHQQLLNLARRPLGLQAMGRPWRQKIGSNDKYKWKLFIGQVPLEATEETLWELFSPIGPILELYILRNDNGKSRGCAFITYQTKGSAEKAIIAVNGCHMTSGKILVVKFADCSSANNTAAVAAPTQ